MPWTNVIVDEETFDFWSRCNKDKGGSAALCYLVAGSRSNLFVAILCTLYAAGNVSGGHRWTFSWKRRWDHVSDCSAVLTAGRPTPRRIKENVEVMRFGLPCVQIKKMAFIFLCSLEWLVSTCAHCLLSVVRKDFRKGNFLTFQSWTQLRVSIVVRNRSSQQEIGLWNSRGLRSFLERSCLNCDASLFYSLIT